MKAYVKTCEVTLDVLCCMMLSLHETKNRGKNSQLSLGVDNLRLLL